MPRMMSHAVDLLKLATDDIDNSPTFRMARELLVDCENIVILGFGYDTDNLRQLDLITAEKQLVPTGVAEIFGTAYGIEEPRRTEVLKRLGSRTYLGSPQVKIEQFLQELNDYRTGHPSNP